jgi:RHS repeat-associated protein
MSEVISFDAQTPSLPEGGGAVSGLGETFSPEPTSGTGSYAIPLDLPTGPDSIGPRLSLRYDTGGGNGAFGMGFSLPLLRLVRSLTGGFPHYDDSDTLVLEGVGDLVATGGGTFRPAIDMATWRVEPSGDGFRITDKQGLFYFLGTSPGARLTEPATGRVFAWHLERIEDALGNSAAFTWKRDGNQLFLDTVAYGVYDVSLQYEDRPDLIRLGRAGFLITIGLRCTTIELRIPEDPQPLLRRWSLTYVQDEANGCSLLTEVKLTGFDPNNQQIVSPALRLGYSSFRNRDLLRFGNQDDGAPPGPLNRVDRRVELLDWNGDGLPDLLEIAGGGQARLWPNLGDCMWGRPRSLGALPQFATSDDAVAFVDMDGDGCADLIRLARPISGYQPHLPAGGFGRPVSFPRSPSVLASAANARLVDLDGDGILDLLSSSRDNLTLHLRVDSDDWSNIPIVVPRRTAAPDVDLADPHVFTADMTGDGIDDIVRVDGGGVTYWQNLGGGRWASPVVMLNPPGLPFDCQSDRLFLSDIDGDGCADLIYLDRGRVLYWLNQSGNGFSDVYTVDYVPTGQISEVRLADMRGSGTAGLLWSTAGPFGRGTIYYYLDFTADSKPHLLEQIDNGIGLTTRVRYTTSAREAAADTRAGRPWPTFLPVVVSVVASTTATDAATGRKRVINYHYHEGRYDGVLREFCGFGRVDEEQIGDETAPTLRTTTSYHIGLDLNSMREPATREERLRLRALRGRPWRQDRYGIDGSVQQGLPYDVLEQDWMPIAQPVDPGTVYAPRLLMSRRSNFERVAMEKASVVSTTNNAWDANGNVTDSIQTGEVVGDPAQTISVRTLTQFANDPTGRFLASAWRVQQSDGLGNIIADTITHYDNAADGTIGAEGVVTRISRLVLTDAVVTDVYGAAPPDFAALGYFRRPEVNGWWATQASYRRYEDVGGLHAQIIGPSGATTTFDFDARRTYPARITDPRGNVVTGEHDYRVCRLSHLVDASGAESFAVFDALARQTAAVKPGDTVGLPTLAHHYITATLPNEVVHNQRAISGAAGTLVSREFYDGTGELLEQRHRDETGEIVAASRLFSARGLLAKVYAEHRPASAAYALPSDDLPHIDYYYDALGRLIRQKRANGTFRTLTISPLLVEDADEEDTRGGDGATHAGTSTRRHLNALGQLRLLEQNLGGKLVPTSYELDVKGNIVSHTDALGNTVRIWYDLLGQIIRSDRPERITLMVLDASGNLVEVRNADGTLVLRQFDECQRLTSVRFGPALPPIIHYTYHDTGFPAPLEAGAHTIGGHCVRIDDEGGTTIYDYDIRGQVALKRYIIRGGGTAYDLNFEYRADGQLAAITYPDGGNGRLTVSYEYDARGNVSRVPGVVEAIAYDLARRRTRVLYANGVEQLVAYDLLTSRLTEMRLTGATGVLREQMYTFDQVGNLLQINSPDPKLAATYTYDNLYRLTGAQYGDGATWNYRYDPAGNLTFKSDVGNYQYGENGAPSTCLTSAGDGAFTYTPNGEMLATPWGTQTFDPLGRLVSIVAGNGVSEVNFTYDFAGVRVAERSVGVVPAVDRVTPDSLYSIEDGVLTLHLFDSHGIVAWQPVGGAMTFLHPDHQGGLAAVTDLAGVLLEAIRSDPYGKIIERNPAGPLLPISFAGGMLNDWSGLLYLLSRHCHPGLGRFVSPDVIVGNVNDPMAWNPYAYCGNNPATHVDPTGTWFFLIPFAVGFVWGLVYGLADGKSLEDSLGIAAETGLTTGFGALLGGAVLGTFGALMGGINGLFTGTRQIYQWRSIEGWASFLSDSSWGIIGTSLGNIANIYDRIAAPSSYCTQLSRRQNRQVYNSGLFIEKNDALTFGNVTSNLLGGGGAPNILRHETVHIMQNRIFGPLYIGVSVAWYVYGGAVGATVGALISGDPWVIVGALVGGPLGAIVVGLLDSDGRQGARDVAYLDNPWELWAYSVQGNRDSGKGPLAF